MATKTKAKELGRPVNTDSEQTRQNIVNAAKECFGTAGFRSTSSRHIAERAGVAAATIYCSKLGFPRVRIAGQMG